MLLPGMGALPLRTGLSTWLPSLALAQPFVLERLHATGDATPRWRASMRAMRTRSFSTALGLFVLAAGVVSAWMLVPLSDRPLASLTSSQGDRVIWGWALATLALGVACLWIVVLVHALVQRAQRRGAEQKPGTGAGQAPL